MNDILLMENNVIENDPGNVSNIINEYYVIIPRSIGDDDFISIDDQFEDINKNSRKTFQCTSYKRINKI